MIESKAPSIPCAVLIYVFEGLVCGQLVEQCLGLLHDGIAGNEVLVYSGVFELQLMHIG